MTLISRKPGPDRITWVCPYSGGMERRLSWVAPSEASKPLCAFSHRMISRRRGCPAAMLQSTWRERTSSTLSAGQPGPEADILQSRGPILMGTCELWRLGLADGELNLYSELLVPSPSLLHTHLPFFPVGGPYSPFRMPPSTCAFSLYRRGGPFL